MRIYNTQTRKKEEFETLEPGVVKMYVCGPTVYNFFHLGNARPFITYDTMRRYLEYRGYKVKYVQNFTDIDDKMIARANNENMTVRALADRFIEEYYHDADRLNIQRADAHPRATDCIPTILDMIRTLIDKDYAYATSDGVYFDVSKHEGYGKLSNHKLEDLEAGASDRLSGEDDKRNNADFALWKFKKEGEPAWESPWGDGRPGWHIECSAMVKAYLGDTIDIHGGGQDLVFPHHENEIAQSEAANEKPFVRYWMHNGFINIDHEKMSKSSGNFFTVRDLVKHYDYKILRFFMLSGHYRMPINFSADLLKAAENGWKRIETCLENLKFISQTAPEQYTGEAAGKAEALLSEDCAAAKKAFIKVMDDDLNTADALAAIFDLVRSANTAVKTTGISKAILQQTANLMIELLGILGLKAEQENHVPKQILELLQQRSEAKKNKDYALADRIRNEIHSQDFIIEDTPQGPKVTHK